jgi:hypothetical protein
MGTGVGWGVELRVGLFEHPLAFLRAARRWPLELGQLAPLPDPKQPTRSQRVSFVRILRQLLHSASVVAHSPVMQNTRCPLLAAELQQLLLRSLFFECTGLPSRRGSTQTANWRVQPEHHRRSVWTYASSNTRQLRRSLLMYASSIRAQQRSHRCHASRQRRDAQLSTRPNQADVL